MAPGDPTFRKAIGIITLGMALPAIPAALAREQLVASLSYELFLGAVALTFAFAVLAVFERWSLDRITFAVALVVWPWVLYFGTIFGVLLLNREELIAQGPVARLVRTLYGHHWIWGSEPPMEFAYGVAFMLAGLGAVAIASLRHRQVLHQTGFFE